MPAQTQPNLCKQGGAGMDQNKFIRDRFEILLLKFVAGQNEFRMWWMSIRTDIKFLWPAFDPDRGRWGFRTYRCRIFFLFSFIEQGTFILLRSRQMRSPNKCTIEGIFSFFLLIKKHDIYFLAAGQMRSSNIPGEIFFFFKFLSKTSECLTNEARDNGRRQTEKPWAALRLGSGCPTYHGGY